MKQNLLQQIVLYRYRYVIGYALFLIVLVGLLTLELTRIPSGLTEAEMQSTVHSAQLSLKPDARVIDLPYHLLQNASIYLFGLSAFAIKLPSVIIATASGVGLLLLLRRWFHKNVAIISALLAVSSSTFLISGRTGTPDIMVIFWATYLLLLATLITQEAKGQYIGKILFGLLIGLSLYTPLSIYILGAALIAGFLHPHARYTLKRYGSPELAGAVFLFVLAIIPLAVGLWHTPDMIYRLTGIPERIPGGEEYASSLMGVFVHLAGFTLPSIAETIQPALNIAMLVLIILGILKALSDFHATRTYALLIWSAVLIPVIALNTHHTVGLYVPAMLFMAIGTETLISEWYSLFPRNPYARLAGLLPLIALIGGVWYYNLSTYFVGYRYSPATAEVFNNDLTLLRKYTSQQNRKTMCVVTNKEWYEFYRLLEEKPKAPYFSDRSSIEVTTPDKKDCRANIVSRSAAKAYQDQKPTTFLVNGERKDSLRWYIYQR